MTESQQFVLAIIGEKAAGKGTVTQLLQDHYSAFVARFSDPIRVADLFQRSGRPIEDPKHLSDLTTDIVSRYSTGQGDMNLEDLYADYGIAPPTTGDLQTSGNTWRAQEGSGIFTTVLLDAVDQRPEKLIVIDGIRNPGEIDPLQQNVADHHVLLAIRADQNIRAQRFLEKRKRLGDPVTCETFLALDDRDRGIGEPPDGQQVAACLALVDESNTLWNNESLDALQKQLHTWVATTIPASFLHS